MSVPGLALDAPGDQPGFEEVETPLSAAAPRTAAFLMGTTSVSEGLRTVAMRLRVDGRAAAVRTLAVTSSIEGEGKTSVTLGLAAAFAQAGTRVLVIDADLRQRSIHETLGLRPSPGLTDWLEATTTVLPLRRIVPAGFHLLSAGELPCRPDLLGGPRMLRLLRAAELRFERVIVDCAPLLPVADTLALRAHVSSFLLVARSRLTPRAALRRAFSLVGEEHVLGVILNGHSSRLPNRSRYSYAYGYGYGYGGRGGRAGSKPR
ncbi:MAG TPA: CpsD/CapB family tyrosine-protein kinase [Vicinamibacteria bacterium]|nr:CpsD/CapB family tyrosine-protein kinase [Vicinamibacteria bacterium]